MSNPVKIDLDSLRAVLETADGFREQGAHVVLETDGDGKTRLVAKEGPASGAQPLFEIEARPSKRGLGFNRMFELPKVEVELPDQSRHEISLNDEVDALFWGRAAIDKFVRPYYARLHDGAKLKAMIDDRIDDPDTVALLHCCRTVSMSVTGLSLGALVKKESQGPGPKFRLI